MPVSMRFTGGEIATAKTLIAVLEGRSLLADWVLTARELAADLRTPGTQWIHDKIRRRRVSASMDRKDGDGSTMALR
jgi:hypothetical protein